jgi:adenosylcobinamide-GDP ribazoletransferase
MPKPVAGAGGGGSPESDVPWRIRVMWRAFLIAGRFLTRLPLPDPGAVSGPDLGRSLAFYPLVGVVIGLLVWVTGRLLVASGFPSIDLAAVLVLVTWVWLTGGMHLDGLADTADAWIGGLGDRNRTLEIMKDPRSGPFAVMALVLVLLCKWTAIAALMGMGATMSLVWIPALARVQLPVVFLTTPYLRPKGMGSGVAAHLATVATWSGSALVLGISLLFLGRQAIFLALVTTMVFLVWRRSVMSRLSGFTGDTAGALVELGEALMLVTAVLFS